MTWAPLTAGLILGATEFDEDLSDWAADHRPLFGSTDRAADVSDFFRSSLLIGMATSSVLAPLPSAGNDRNAFAFRLAANGLAYGTNRFSTDRLKGAFGRERPDKEDDRSLPSGHSSSAFNAAASTELNFANADLQPNDRLAMRTGLYGMAAATAWARLEARKHFPSDVLAGAALGNFLARFFFGAISGPSTQPPVAFETDSGQLVLRLNHAL